MDLAEHLEGGSPKQWRRAITQNPTLTSSRSPQKGIERLEYLGRSEPNAKAKAAKVKAAEAKAAETKTAEAKVAEAKREEKTRENAFEPSLDLAKHRKEPSFPRAPGTAPSKSDLSEYCQGDAFTFRQEQTKEEVPEKRRTSIWNLSLLKQLRTLRKEPSYSRSKSKSRIEEESAAEDLPTAPALKTATDTASLQKSQSIGWSSHLKLDASSQKEPYYTLPSSPQSTTKKLRKSKTDNNFHSKPHNRRFSEDYKSHAHTSQPASLPSSAKRLQRERQALVSDDSSRPPQLSAAEFKTESLTRQRDKDPHMDRILPSGRGSRSNSKMLQHTDVLNVGEVMDTAKRPDPES